MARRSKTADILAAADANPPQHIPSGPKIDRNVLLPGHRIRHDGWTQERTQRFLDALGHTGCVRDAARIAGVSNVAGYRLKRDYPLFSAAWDEALKRAQQGLIAIAYRRAVEGRETIIIRKGEEVERRIQPSDAMLGLMIKRGDMKDGAGGDGGDALAAAISWAEWQSGIRFTVAGEKYQDQPDDASRKAFRDRMMALRERMIENAEAGGYCLRCEQPLPTAKDNRSMAEMVASGVVGMGDLFP
jgi:hypothetical protein